MAISANHALTLADRIESNFLARQDECSLARNWKTTLRDGASEEEIAQACSELALVVHRLELRSTTRQAAEADVATYGSRTEDIEEHLLESFAHEQTSQHRVARRLLLAATAHYVAVFAFCTVAATAPELDRLIVSSILLSLVVCAFLASRLYQNAREAAERIDEKTIAIKFIRYGLRALVDGPNRHAVLDAGVKMFIDHHSESSTPLGVQDWSGLADILRGR